MKRKAILLLGGFGFIGSALAQRLRQDGETLHVLGRHNLDGLEALLPECGTVLHLASATTPGLSANQPVLEAENLELTLRLMQALQAQPQTHLVFFSSGGTVYGDPAVLPVGEDSPLTPLSPHGAGKVAQEAFCQVARARGTPVTILRPANAYGPGQDLRPGFGLIRTMLEHVRQDTVLEIWGDGETVRDYIHIDDVVEATRRLVQLPQDCGTYNLGSGVGHSINQVRQLVEQSCGRSLQTVYRPARGLDVHSVVLDTTRLRRQTAWQPRVALADGIGRCWQALQAA